MCVCIYILTRSFRPSFATYILPLTSSKHEFCIFPIILVSNLYFTKKKLRKCHKSLKPIVAKLASNNSPI